MEVFNSCFFRIITNEGEKEEDLKKEKFFIVAFPTPIYEQNLPDLKPLIGSSTTVGKVLKKGDYVVYESTVYPGCTEEDCVPILERESKLKFVTICQNKLKALPPSCDNAGELILCFR